MEKLKKHEEEEGRRKDNFLQDGYRVEPTDHGLMLYTLKDIPIGESLYLFKEFSYGEAMLLTSLVRPGMTVIDVGANFGCMTLPLARKVGRQGCVLAFEPQRYVYYNLCTNVLLNNHYHVQCERQAVGKTLGSVKVPVLGGNSTEKPGIDFGFLGVGAEGCYLQNLDGNQSMEGEDEVPLMTLDSKNLSQCHLIKIDVEGYEEDVLLGAESLIQRCRPLIWVEENDVQGIASFMFSRNYKIKPIRTSIIHPKKEIKNPFIGQVGKEQVCQEVDEIGVNLKRMVCFNMLCYPQEYQGLPETLNACPSFGNAEEFKTYLQEIFTRKVM